MKPSEMRDIANKLTTVGDNTRNATALLGAMMWEVGAEIVASLNRIEARLEKTRLQQIEAQKTNRSAATDADL